MTHVFSETVYADTLDLAKKTKSVFDKDGDLKDNQVSLAIDILALSRDALRAVDAEYTEHVEPIKSQLAPFDADRKALKKSLEAVELSMKDGLLSRLNGHGELPDESKNGTKLSITLRPTLVVTNPALIPDKFLLPRAQCIDTAALAEYLKHELAVNKALVAQGEPERPLSVQGVALDRHVILTTRLAETIA